MIRFRYGVCVFAILALSGCPGRNTNSPNEKIMKVGLTQIASHPSLDAVRQGIIDGLREAGWDESRNIKYLYRNANRDPALSVPIAQSFVAEKVDVIVPITTPSALAAKKVTSDVPIVFGGVTDPIGIGLVNSLEHPGSNITGTSDRWPFEKQIQLFVEALPSIRKLGMLYAPGDNVSDIAVREFRQLCPMYKLELITLPVSSTQDLYSASRKLFREVDAVYTGLDTLVVANLDSVLKAGREVSKPVLAGDVGTVERGALMTHSIDMHELGRITATIVDKVLRGAVPGDIPVIVVSNGSPVFNATEVSRLRINLSHELRTRATFVGQGQ